MDGHYMEALLVVVNILMLFVNLTVSAKVADMRTLMFEKFLSKEDFREWTKSNSRLVNFKEH